MAAAVRAGVAEERIQLDPGIGFGKTLAHNLELLARLDELTELGRPLVIGTSRKSFLGKLTGPRRHRACPRDRRHLRDRASSAAPRVFRVHDVAAVSDALKVANATVAAWPTSPRTTTTTT